MTRQAAIVCAASLPADETAPQSFDLKENLRDLHVIYLGCISPAALLPLHITANELKP